MITICLDFDGVLHTYESGWQGIDVVADEPVPGAKVFVEELIKMGYRVVVLSARFNTDERWLERTDSLENHESNDFDMQVAPEVAMNAVQNWLDKYGFPKEIELVNTKVPADLYIDDRGYRFEGSFSHVLDYIRKNPTFPIWNRDRQ